MSLLNYFTGPTKTKVALAKEKDYDAADEHLRRLEANREQMRENLSRALKRVIEDNR